MSESQKIIFWWWFQDESALIWFSGKEEKYLKLSHVSRIISGQRTVSSLLYREYYGKFIQFFNFENCMQLVRMRLLHILFKP